MTKEQRKVSVKDRLLELPHAPSSSVDDIYPELCTRSFPSPIFKAIDVITGSLTPPLTKTEQNGLGVFFYLPHVCFVADYGMNPQFNAGKDPFEASMRAQYELTRRFSAEFSIGNFLINHQERTLERLKDDPELYARRSVANHIGDIASSV